MRAVIVLALAAGLTRGAAPPAAPTAGQAALLRERDALTERARGEWNAGRRAEAIATLREALRLLERVHGRASTAGADAHAWLARCEEGRGGWKDAAAHREWVWRAAAVLWGEGHWRGRDARREWQEAVAHAGRTPAQRDALARAATLHQEVLSLAERGEAAQAIRVGEEQLKLVRGVVGRWHPFYAKTLNNLAAMHRAVGGQEPALRMFLEALEVRGKVLGERHPDYATTMNNLGGLRKDMGDHRAALALYRRALAIRKETLGVGHPDYATSLNNLAQLLKETGDHTAALPLSREALRLAEAAWGRRHPHYAGTLGNLASLYQAMGDYEAALPLFEGCLKAYEGSVGRRHPDCATALNNLALVRKDMGDHKGALALLREALVLVERSLGRRHLRYASTLGNVALLHGVMKDYGAALPLLRQAVKLREEVVGRRHPSYAVGLGDLAAMHQEMGEHRAALPLFRESLEILEGAQGGRHPAYGAALCDLALLHSVMGAHEEALPLAEEALALAIGQLRAEAAVQSDRQQLAAAALLRYRLDCRMLIRDGPRHLTAADHALAWKGTLLLRQQRRRLFLRLADDPAARKAAEALQDVTRRLAALRLSPSATREALETLHRGQEEAQAELSRLSAEFRAAREKGVVTAARVAEALPEGVALVDYLFHGGRLTAFVHRRGRPAARVGLGLAAPARAAVRGWRDALVRRQAGHAEGQVVKRLVWLPLEGHLEGANVVLISPDGVLGSVPFAALPGRKKGAYLIEEAAAAVVPVPSAIPEMLGPKGGRLAPSLLAVGGLRYEPDDTPATPASADGRAGPRFGREKFVRLPATAAEALAVRASFEGLFKKGAVTSLRDGEATKAAVREALAGVRYAHLATHGYFAPEAAKSGLTAGGRDRREVVGWHPLLLSGLALSDANREPKAGEEDGILTALEVSEMDLSRLELATLSACETGLGKVAGGEGLLGMQRAFQIAGVRTVIASLWKVDDRATQMLMGELYTSAWDPRKIIPRAEALRRAQLTMLREGRRGIGKVAEKAEDPSSRLPPYYWAAFVLSGDWR